MSGKLEAKLQQMGYQLPPPFTFPKNNRTGCTQAGSVLYLSGQLGIGPGGKHAATLHRHLHAALLASQAGVLAELDLLCDEALQPGVRDLVGPDRVQPESAVA